MLAASPLIGKVYPNLGFNVTNTLRTQRYEFPDVNNSLVSNAKKVFQITTHGCCIQSKTSKCHHWCTCPHIAEYYNENLEVLAKERHFLTPEMQFL